MMTSLDHQPDQRELSVGDAVGHSLGVPAISVRTSEADLRQLAAELERKLPRRIVMSSHLEFVDHIATGETMLTWGARPTLPSDAHIATPRRLTDGVRGKVDRRQSQRSRDRFVRRAVTCHPAFEPPRVSVLAVTTHGDEAPSLREHVAQRIKLRKRLQRALDGLRWEWIWHAEVQRRGAAHDNWLMSIDHGALDHDELLQLVASTWLDVSGLGGSSYAARMKHGTRGAPIRGFEGAVSYASRELGKLEQKDLDAVGAVGTWRWWGNSMTLPDWSAPTTIARLTRGGRERLRMVDALLRPHLRGERQEWLDDPNPVVLARTQWDAGAAAAILDDNWAPLLLDLQRRQASLRLSPPANAGGGVASPRGRPADVLA